MNTLILHLGSNLGNRQENLENAMPFIDQELGEILGQSSVYETQAWLGPNSATLPKEVREQAPFLNITLKISVSTSSMEALNICMGIETKLGRVRKHKWGARRIDIDLIFYNDEIINSAKLILPHPWMQNRRFVLAPLAEMVPDWIHPVFKKTVLEILEDCQDEGRVEKLVSKFK